MLTAFSKGVDQLNDRNTRKFLWWAVLSAIGTVMVLWIVVDMVLTRTSLTDIGWLDSAIDILGGFATLVLTWFLFPATVSAVVGFFLEDIAAAVEARHYPTLPPAKGQTMLEALGTTFKFLGILVVLNILMLPFLFLGPVFPFVFYAVNGYLLGREYFELVASRRLPVSEVAQMRKAHQGSLILVGVVIAFSLTIPLINLLMPVVATSAMVHLFEGWRRGNGTDVVRA